MRQLLKWTPVILILVAAVGTAFTAQPGSVGAPQVASEASMSAEDMALARAKQRARSPMMVEIDALIATQASELARLEAKVAAATDPTQWIAVQHQIAAIKEQTEIDILNVQLAHARSKGDAELAKEIELGIRALTSPPEPIAPDARKPRDDAPTGSGN